MPEKSIYDDVGHCIECPYLEECKAVTGCGGYTMHDEFGECPSDLVARYRAIKE